MSSEQPVGRGITAEPAGIAAEPVDLTAELAGIAAEPADLAAELAGIAAEPADLAAELAGTAAEPADLTAELAGTAAEPPAEVTSSRWPHVVAALCIGAALGLLVYRFAVLGLGWRSSRGFVFPAVACVLAALGVAAIRLAKRGGPRPTTLLALGAVGGAMAAACAFAIVPPLGSTALVPWTLPGFTIALPPGDVVKEQIEYQQGTLRLGRVAGTGAVVAVNWERGTASLDDLEHAARALEPTLGKTAPPSRGTTHGPRGLALDTLAIESRKGDVAMTFVPCGVRRVLVTTAGEGAAALLERIAPTLVCTPEPAQEAEPVGVVPVAVELPGWFAVERRVGQLVLSDGAATLVIRGGLPRQRPLETAAAAILDRAGIRATLGPLDGDRLAFEGTAGGRPITGWARRIACGGAAVALVGYATDRATADRASHQASLARCLRSDEPAQRWPDAP